MPIKKEKDNRDSWFVTIMQMINLTWNAAGQYLLLKWTKEKKEAKELIKSVKF